MSNLPHEDRLANVAAELRRELAGTGELAGDWMRRAARALVEQMLAAEVDETLGRMARAGASEAKSAPDEWPGAQPIPKPAN